MLTTEDVDKMNRYIALAMPVELTGRMAINSPEIRIFARAEPSGVYAVYSIQTDFPMSAYFPEADLWVRGELRFYGYEKVAIHQTATPVSMEALRAGIAGGYEALVREKILRG